MMAPENFSLKHRSFEDFIELARRVGEAKKLANRVIEQLHIGCGYFYEETTHFMVASRKVFTLAAALAAGALVSAGAAQATTTLYWGGNTPGTSGNWSTSTSDTPWATTSTGAIGTDWTDGDNANFQNGGTDTVTVVGTIGATTPVPTITVNNSTTADLLGSDTVNVSGSGAGAGLAGAANSTLVVDGPTVNFTGALRKAEANLTVDGGTVNITSRLSAGVAGWAGKFSGGTTNIDLGTSAYGIRLGDDSFSYNGGGGNTGTGQLSVTITQDTGSTVAVGGGVTGGVQIGSGSTAGTAATDTYTLNGGSLTTTNLQIAANGTNETAEFDLVGGTITVTNSTPTTANGDGLVFGTSLGSGSSAAFNFVTGNGMLILKDANNGSTAWNFSTLTGIANSDFLVNGTAATSSELTFAADTNLSGYTDISLAPEPASLGLLAVGGMGLLLVRRKKAC